MQLLGLRRHLLECALLPFLLLVTPALAGNACQAEITSACPERPGSEMARCLKDKDEHDKPTSISSECTDFIALNVACSDDISKFCDDGFFTDDTVLCLSEWTPRENLGTKCAKVVQWAAPGKEGEGPTDELGLSAQDYEEKRKWQADRKASRGAAIEKMRGDKKEEQEIETMKKEDPEGYKLLQKEKAEAKKSYEELKKRKRLLAAAEERKQREENGEEELPDEEEERKSKRRRPIRKTESTGWLPYALGGCGALFVVMNIVNFFSKEAPKEEKED